MSELDLERLRRLGAEDSPAHFAGCVMVPNDWWPGIIAALERAERLEDAAHAALAWALGQGYLPTGALGELADALPDEKPPVEEGGRG